jgi:hypothetical protein
MIIIDVKAKFVMTVFKQETLEGTDGSRINSHLPHPRTTKDLSRENSYEGDAI